MKTISHVRNYLLNEAGTNWKTQATPLDLLELRILHFVTSIPDCKSGDICKSILTEGCPLVCLIITV